MKTLIDKQIIYLDNIFEHVHTKAQFKVVAFDIVESSFTFKVEMIENKNNIEHRNGFGAIRDDKGHIVATSRLITI